MKNIALTSLVAVFAASSAMASNISSPLYRPEAGHFYSETGVASATNQEIQLISTYNVANTGTQGATVSEKFGYGITDRFAVTVNTSATTANWFDTTVWNNLGVELNWRALNHGAWKADIFGGYQALDIRGYDEVAFNNPGHAWTVGTKAGYQGQIFAVAGHVAMDYVTEKPFGWDKSHEDGERMNHHFIRAGLDAQLFVSENWNLVGGAEYVTDYDNWSYNPGYWVATFGANYNIDAAKYVGAYISKVITHEPDDMSSAGNWEAADGFIFGAKFGIDF